MTTKLCELCVSFPCRCALRYPTPPSEEMGEVELIAMECVSRPWTPLECAQICASHRALAQRLREVEQERDSLNLVLRDAGWGQGEIDSAASVDDHVDTLNQRIAQLEAQVGL